MSIDFKSAGQIALSAAGAIGFAAAMGLALAGSLHAAGGAPEGGGAVEWNANLDAEESEQYQAMHSEADRENGIEVYEVCAGCHLTEGWGSEDGTFPQIAGQHRTILVKQMADIRAGNRDNPTMYPFATTRAVGGVQAMADVTAYIASLPMNPNNGVGPGDNLEHGKKLYEENCTRCHGANGEGDAEKYYPLIQGQHYEYMLRQFEWIRDGKRRNANPDMVKQIAEFSDDDMRAVIDYSSRLKPPAEKLAQPGWKNPDYD
jgi:cytochrome c553